MEVPEPPASLTLIAWHHPSPMWPFLKMIKVALISAVIALLGVVGWEEAEAGGHWSGPEMKAGDERPH